MPKKSSRSTVNGLNNSSIYLNIKIENLFIIINLIIITMSCLTNNQLDSSLDSKIDKKNSVLPIKKEPKKKSYKQLIAEITKSTSDNKPTISGLGGGQFSKIDKI